MDKKAFTAAVERRQNMVYRIALHYFASPPDAEDAVQEVFLRLFTYQKPFESEEHLRRWLIRVTVNVCKDMLKSRWRKKRVPLDSVAELPVFDRTEDLDLYRAVMALPERYRTVLDLFYYEELSTGEIAEVMGLTVSATTTRLSRARSALKETLGEGWQDDE